MKSIAYRHKLLKQLPEMEVELLRYVQSNGSRYIASYEVEVYDGRLSLRKLAPLDYKQLRLRLGEGSIPE